MRSSLFSEFPSILTDSHVSAFSHQADLAMITWSPMIFHGFLTSCFEVCGNWCHGEGGEEEGGKILAAGGDSLVAQMV